MTLIPHQFVYRGDLGGLGAFNSQCFVDALATGDIVAVYFKAQGVTSFTDDWYFGLKLNGTDILLGADRPHITSGSLAPSTTGLNIAVTFRDRLVPTVDARNLGVINGPIDVIVVIDDHITPGISDTAYDATAWNGVVDVAPSKNAVRDKVELMETEIAAKAADSAVVHNTGAETVAGAKTFTSSPLVPNTPSGSTAAVNKAYADALVVGLLDDRGNYDASGNVFPSSGGSGSAGAILKGDLWFISVAGALGGVAVNIGDQVRALVDTPGSTAGNWAVSEANIGYVPENVANKDTDGTLAANSDTKYASQKASKTYADSKVSDTAYDATTWDGDTTHAPSKNAVRDKIESLAGSTVDDTAYDATTWDGDTTHSPSKNAVRDKVQLMETEIAGKVDDTAYNATSWDAVTTTAPSKNAVRDKIEAMETEIAGKADLTGATFSGDVSVPVDVYGAGWNGSAHAPSKDAVYDKIEAIIAGIPGSYTDEQAQDAVGTILDNGTVGDINFTYDDPTPKISGAIKSGVALSGTPTAPTAAPGTANTQLATTAFVASALLGQNFKEAAKYATTGALPAVTYANGSSGVGATLTGVSFGALSIDGSTPSVGDRILVKNQVSGLQNGIYTVTVVGGVATLFVLTRATDFNQSAEINSGDSMFIRSGTAEGTTTWVYSGADGPTIGTDALTFVQTAGQGAFSAGNGIAITGNSVAIDTAITVDKTTAQTLTNKTLTSPAINTPTGIVKGDVGLGNVDNTSDATKNAAAVALTNKTIVAGSNTITGITEAMQTLADNTTNNASTANHGYLKKLDNNANHYMGGDGNWTTPAGSVTLGQVLAQQGGMTLP